MSQVRWQKRHMHERKQTYDTSSDNASPPLKRTCPTCGLDLDITVTVCPQDGTQLQSSLETEPEFQSKYQFLGTIGKGGMGVIYKARQVLLGKLVAIKMLHAHLATPEAYQRFQVEGKASCLLSHPNIIAVHDFGTTQSGQPYMVMDYVEGRTLAQCLAAEGHLELDPFFRIFLQVCEGLEHAHRRGVLHRDIKPSNIMLVDGGNGKEDVRIMDFGIAKILDDTTYGGQQLTKTGEAVGSPIYMSPEQARGQKMDLRSDIYSLGCMMYEALTGAPPFIGKTALDTMMMHLNDKPMPVTQASMGKTMNPELERIVMRLIEKDPDKRYQSMSELISDLSAIQSYTVSGRAIGRFYAPPNRPLEQEQEQKKKITANSAALIALCIVALGAAGGTVGYVLTKPRLAPVTQPKKMTPLEEAVFSPFASPDASKGEKDELSPEQLVAHMCQTETEVRLSDTANVTNRAFKDDDFKPFLSATLPKKLNMQELTVGDKALEYLKNLKLSVLQLSGTYVRTLHGIKDMQTLEFVDAARCSLTPEAYSVIGHLKHLKRVTLDNTPIADADLHSLYGLKELETASLLTDPNLTEEGISQFKKHLPKCIVWTGDAAANTKRAHDADDTLTLLDEANKLATSAKWAEAAEDYKKLIQIFEDEPRRPLVKLWHCYDAYGDCLSHMQKFREAMVQYRNVLSIARLKDVDNPNIPITMHKIAICHESLGNVKEAIKVRLQARKIFTKVPLDVADIGGPQSWQAMNAINFLSLANDYSRLGDQAKAQPLFHESLNAWAAGGRASSIEAGSTWVSLANCLMAGNDYADAIKSLEHALNIFSTPENKDKAGVHDGIRNANWLLAVCYERSGRDTDALPLAEQVVAADAADAKEVRIVHVNFLVNILTKLKKSEELAKYTALHDQLTRGTTH